jgi:hypothetical protein
MSPIEDDPKPAGGLAAVLKSIGILAVLMPSTATDLNTASRATSRGRTSSTNSAARPASIVALASVVIALLARRRA